MACLHMFSHHCESTVKTFGPLQTYYPTMNVMVSNATTHVDARGAGVQRAGDLSR